MSPDELKALVEDKFVDSLGATAATMTIQELQDKRRDFVQAVQNAVAEDLEKNGLELESVSLTSLDQTDKQFFHPNNAFDAEGLPNILEQAVRPMEKIESIRIVQVGGMPGTGAANESAAGAGKPAATFPEQVMNSALQYQLAKPIVDAVMKDAGLSNEGITGVAQALSGMMKKADG
jgi:uncharacterized membrane protein YqiK